MRDERLSLSCGQAAFFSRSLAHSHLCSSNARFHGHRARVIKVSTSMHQISFLITFFITSASTINCWQLIAEGCPGEHMSIGAETILFLCFSMKSQIIIERSWASINLNAMADACTAVAAKNVQFQWSCTWRTEEWTSWLLQIVLLMHKWVTLTQIHTKCNQHQLQVFMHPID